MDALTIEPYNAASETFDSYYRRFINLLKAKTVTNAEQQNAAFLAVMGKDAYQLLSSLVSPDSPDDRSCADNYRTLLAHYQPKTIVILETFNFYKRNQLPGESVANYLASLRQLATRCDFGAGLDRALRDRFVCGLSSDATQKRLLTETDLKLEKAVQIAQAIEAGEKSSKIIKQNGNGNGNCNGFSEIFKVTHSQPQNRQQPSCPCFRCLSRDHTPNQCHHRNAICHSCSAKGHIRRACKSIGGVQDEPESGNRQQRRSQQPGAGSRDGVHAVSAGSEAARYESELLNCNAVALDEMDVLSVEYCQDGTKAYSGDDIDAELIQVFAFVNDELLCFKFDTGSSATIISSDLWSAILDAPTLEPTDRVLVSFCGNRTVPLGEFTANVRVLPDKEAKLKIFVVAGNNRTAILGRNATRLFPEIREFANRCAATANNDPKPRSTTTLPLAVKLLLLAFLVLLVGRIGVSAAGAATLKQTTSSAATAPPTRATTSTAAAATTATTPSLRQLLYAEYMNPDISDTRRAILKPAVKELFGDDIQFYDDEHYTDDNAAAGTGPPNATMHDCKRKQMFLFGLVRTNYYMILAVVLAIPLFIYICLWAKFRNPASCHFVVPVNFRRRRRLPS